MQTHIPRAPRTHPPLQAVMAAAQAVVAVTTWRTSTASLLLRACPSAICAVAAAVFFVALLRPRFHMQHR